MEEYILYGNGGFARVVEDLVEVLGGKIIAVYDSNNKYNPNSHSNAKLILAIGNTEARSRIVKEIRHDFATLIHPTASVSRKANIGKGCIILANATIQAQANIGEHVIINANVVVDHDAIIGDFVTTYPGAFFGATAEVQELSRIEGNTVIR